MKLFIAAILITLSLAIGCCPSQEATQARVTVDTVYVPFAMDTVMSLVKIDTMYVAAANDSSVIVRVDTVWRRVWVSVKDTIEIHVTDTISVTQTIFEKVDPSEWYIFTHSIEYWLSTLVLGALLATGGVLWLIKKFKR